MDILEDRKAKKIPFSNLFVVIRYSQYITIKTVIKLNICVDSVLRYCYCFFTPTPPNKKPQKLTPTI